MNLNPEHLERLKDAILSNARNGVCILGNEKTEFMRGKRVSPTRIGRAIAEYTRTKSANAWKQTIERWIKGDPPKDVQVVRSICIFFCVDIYEQIEHSEYLGDLVEYIASQKCTAQGFKEQFEFADSDKALGDLVEAIGAAAEQGKIEHDNYEVVCQQNIAKRTPLVMATDSSDPRFLSKFAGRRVGEFVLRKLNSGSDRVRVAVGLGVTARMVIEAAARFLIHVAQINESKLRRIMFYQIGYSCFPDSNPIRFIPQAFEKWESVVSENVAPPGAAFDFPNNWFKKSIDVTITSVADIKDLHCVVRQHIGKQKAKVLIERLGAKGVVQCWPYSESEFISRDQLESSENGIYLPRSPFAPEDLAELSRSKKKLSLMVVSQCSICSKSKKNAMIPLLAHPKLRTFNQLILPKDMWFRVKNKMAEFCKVKKTKKKKQATRQK